MITYFHNTWWKEGVWKPNLKDSFQETFDGDMLPKFLFYVTAISKIAYTPEV